MKYLYNLLSTNNIDQECRDETINLGWVMLDSVIPSRNWVMLSMHIVQSTEYSDINVRDYLSYLYKKYSDWYDVLLRG